MLCREFPESEISSYSTLHQLQSVSAPSNNHSLLVCNEIYYTIRVQVYISV